MGTRKSAQSPDPAGAMGTDEGDFKTLMMAAYQAGQQAAGTPYQGLSNDGAMMGLFDRFAALFEPLQSLAERQHPLGQGEASDLQQIHASLARVDFSALKSESLRPGSLGSNGPAAAGYKGVAS